ncbi:uncharacterized protein LOC117127522 [Brassica rapa]|uniref:uncharacterized protein LOC117127522 n=1 Tax=Brassica campestris TaxID=3711 RepID=UPI0004F1BB3C|nr:uncharacterized protein LOC117127522 [Brassica rapa]
MFNQAFLAKIAWRIITVPDSFLARILIGKYCHKKNFLEVDLPKVCSHGWRGILQGRNLLREKLGKAIGNGMTTRVWRDSWMSLDEQLKFCGPVQEEALDLKVSDLLTDDMRWNTERIEKFVPEFKEKILRLHPSQAGAEDCFIWHPLPSGIYTTRSGYHSVASNNQERVTTLNTSDFNWIKDIWALPCSPKMKTFLWSVLRDALPLGENLQRRGISSDVRCPRCKEIESPIHIFFMCPFAKEVWANIPLKEAVHIAATDNFSTAMIRFRSSVCLPPTGVTTTVFLWVSTRGLVLAREWGGAQSKVPKLTSHPQTHLRSLPDRTVETELVLPNTTTIKTDAAWDSNRCRAGLAWIAWNGEGREIKKGSSVQDHVSSPLAAEALAVREGLRLAGNLEISNLRIYSDNLTLIGAINNKKQRKEILGIVKDIHLLASAFVSISFHHIGRKNNQDADVLAKQTLRISLL